MSSGASIPPVPPGGAKPAGPQGQIVQIVSLPDGLKNMARAMRIEGEVVRQNSDGTTRIKTPEGDIDIMIRGRQPQTGARIEIDIPLGSPPRNATMRPAAPPPAQSQTPSPQPSPAPGHAPLPSAPVPTPPADSVEVTPRPLPSQPAPAPAPPAAQPQTASPPPGTVAAPPSASAPPAQLPPLAPGQMVTLTPLPPEGAPDGNMAAANGMKTETAAPMLTARTTTKPPAALTALMTAVRSMLPQSIVLPGMTAPTQSGQSAAPSATQPQPLATLQATVVSLIPPSGQSPQPVPGAPASPAPGQNAIAPPVLTSPLAVSSPGTTAPPTSTLPTITVTVAQATPQGLPVIPIPVDTSGKMQNFVIQTPPAAAPIGTQVTLQPIPLAHAKLAPVQPAVPQSGALPPAPAPQNAPLLPPAWRIPLPLMQAASVWPAIDDLFQSFYQATPQAAQILGRVIPSPANPGSFGPSLLLFAAALKSGDLQGWLGEKKLDMIHKLGKADIVSRLASEAAPLAANADAAPSEWKSLPIPLLWQNEISKVLFHVRREPPEDGRDQSEAGTRFVMDLTLTRMGDVQLDGLVRGQRLDVIVRTQEPFSEPMREAMRKAYADALDGSNIYGELGFQGDPRQWVNVTARADTNLVTA